MKTWVSSEAKARSFIQKNFRYDFHCVQPLITLLLLTLRLLYWYLDSLQVAMAHTFTVGLKFHNYIFRC